MAYDYPDFLPTKQPFNEGARYFSQVVTSNATVPAIDTTQYAEVIISVTNLDANAIFELQIGFLASIVDPTPDPIKTVVFGAGQSGNFRVPVLRGQLQIIVVPHGPVATQALEIAEYGITGHVNQYDLYMGKHQILLEQPSLGASGSATFLIPTWYHGPVTVAALADNAANAQVVFDYWEPANGTYIEFTQFGMPGQYANQPQQIFFPPNPVRVRIFNGTTAQSVELYVAASGLNGI